MTDTTDRLADIKARAEAATADPWVYSDCDGWLKIWRERALTHVIRDTNGEIDGFSEPSSYKASDLIVEIKLEGETWDPGEDPGDDQRRTDVEAMVAARQDDVPWLIDQLEQARRIAVELENQVARLTDEQAAPSTPGGA